MTDHSDPETSGAIDCAADSRQLGQDFGAVAVGFDHFAGRAQMPLRSCEAIGDGLAVLVGAVVVRGHYGFDFPGNPPGGISRSHCNRCQTRPTALTGKDRLGGSNVRRPDRLRPPMDADAGGHRGLAGQHRGEWKAAGRGDGDVARAGMTGPVGLAVGRWSSG